jgi:hypothetical protein
MKRIIVLLIFVVFIAGAILGWRYYKQNFTVTLPEYAVPEKRVWLEQNWSAAERTWFHHADQGTISFGIPYEWFSALERPESPLGEPGLLSDPVYLDRFGFIPDSPATASSVLPVGFAHGGPMKHPEGGPWLNPQTKQDMTTLGLTCAACHTGRFTYNKTAVFVDGGPAITRVDDLQKGIGTALLYARYLRFSRFADRVLGPGASEEAKGTLRTELSDVVAQYGHVRDLMKAVNARSVEEGFARLDALNRIGNSVFAIDLKTDSNFTAQSAPVHFPRIWNASWFEWVQYNGSIQQPMVRNAGEALGVLAQVNLTLEKNNLFESTVRIDELYKIEQVLAGSPPPDAKHGFPGLSSPKWPEEILPKISRELAAKGAVLYKNICQECHLPPVNTPEFWDSPRWLPPNAAGERYLDLEVIPVEHIGTDPAQAVDMKNRKVTTPPNLGIKTNGFGGALGDLVQNAVNYWYDQQNPPTPAATRETMNGNRPNGIRDGIGPEDKPGYKVRPLNGIWATPPYLHNGSVPNVYALLSPVDERPKTFFLGNREYDPENLGYRTEEVPGAFELDTSKRGNYNTGHEFNDDSKKPGVIGRKLSPDERRAVIEFLKTL